MKRKVSLSKDKLQPKPKKRFVIQKIEEKAGKEESVEIFEEFKKPFDLDNRDFIGNKLIDIYGPGRYRIVCTDLKTGKETICFLGDVKEHTKGKVWTKKERKEYTRVRRSTNKMKLTTLGIFLAISLFLVVVLFYSLFTLNIPLLITTVVVFAIYLLITLVAMDLAFYETE
jgi:hypothetical protein